MIGGNAGIMREDNSTNHKINKDIDQSFTGWICGAFPLRVNLNETHEGEQTKQSSETTSKLDEPEEGFPQQPFPSWTTKTDKL